MKKTIERAKEIRNMMNDVVIKPGEKVFLVAITIREKLDIVESRQKEYENRLTSLKHEMEIGDFRAVASTARHIEEMSIEADTALRELEEMVNLFDHFYEA